MKAFLCKNRIYPQPVYRMAAYAYENTIVSCRLEKNDGSITRPVFGPYFLPPEVTFETPLLGVAAAAWRLKAYSAGSQNRFSSPPVRTATPFQQKTGQLPGVIPFGQTATYGQIAARTGKPKAWCAAGLANNRHPASIPIPYHRAMGSGSCPAG